MDTFPVFFFDTSLRPEPLMARVFGGGSSPPILSLAPPVFFENESEWAS